VSSKPSVCQYRRNGVEKCGFLPADLLIHASTVHSGQSYQIGKYICRLSLPNWLAGWVILHLRSCALMRIKKSVPTSGLSWTGGVSHWAVSSPIEFAHKSMPQLAFISYPIWSPGSLRDTERILDWVSQSAMDFLSGFLLIWDSSRLKPVLHNRFAPSTFECRCYKQCVGRESGRK
jgi:hypothetical protein